MQKNALFFLYLSGLFIVALYPFEFAPGPLLPRLAEFIPPVHRPNFRVLTEDFFLNILLFVPLGVFLEGLLRSRHRLRLNRVLLVTLAGLLVSLLVEASQLFFHNRFSSAIDLATNTTGALLGATALALLYKGPPLAAPVLRLWDWMWPLIGLACAALALIPLALPIVYPRWYSIDGWDDRARLHLGNQTRFERPWYGRFYRVAIYDHAFGQRAAQEHFLEMKRAGARRPRTEDSKPLVLYELSTAGPEALKDKSGNGANLSVEGRGHPRWNPSKPGLRLRHPVRLSTTLEAGRNITEALKRAGEMTIEAWIAPNNVAQRGPNPIVAFGAGPRNANFVLGQDCANLVFWVRTPATGRKSSTLVARTRSGPLTTSLTHVVACFQDGREELYVNGALAGRLDIREEAMLGLFAFRSNTARLAHVILFFVPLAVVWSADRLRRRRKPVVVPVWSVTVGLLVISELVQAWTGERAIDFRLMLTGVIVLAAVPYLLQVWPPFQHRNASAPVTAK